MPSEPADALVIVKKSGDILVLQPMGARARELIERLRGLGLDFDSRPVFCG